MRFVEKGGDEKKPAENEEERNKGYKEETLERTEDILLLVLFGFGQRRRRAREKDSCKRREAKGSFPLMDSLNSLFIFIYHIVLHFCFIIILLNVAFWFMYGYSVLSIVYMVLCVNMHTSRFICLLPCLNYNPILWVLHRFPLSSLRKHDMGFWRPFFIYLLIFFLRSYLWFGHHLSALFHKLKNTRASMGVLRKQASGSKEQVAKQQQAIMK